MIALLLALATADQVRGTVIDPNQRPLPGAAIEIACDDLMGTAAADASGGFTIDLRAAGACEIRVSHPGFKTLTRSVVVPTASSLTFQLSPADWEEHVEVRARRSTPAQAALGTLGASTATGDAMRVAGPDSARWLALAQRSAGQPAGTYALTVNGMPTSLLPSAEVIASIGAAMDPFSVEVAGADLVMIDITSELPRRWQFDLSPGMLTNRQPDVLLPEASHSAQHRSFGAGGPLTRGGQLRAQVSASTTVARDWPTYVEHHGNGDRLAASIESETKGAAWSGEITGRRGAWELHGSLFRSDAAFANGGIGGRSGPPGALDIVSTARREQLVWRRAGRRVVVRGGIAFERERRDVSSAFSGAGYVFADRLVAGAPDTLATSHRSSATTVRAVAASREAPIRGWLIGLEAARHAVREQRLFNPSGLIFMAGPSEFAGPRLIRAGEVTARAGAEHVAAFAQHVVAEKNRIWARLGARTEWQRDFGLAVSPRVALGLRAGSFLLGGNVGTFSDLWAASEQLERDFRVAAPAFIEGGTAGLPLVFAGDGTRRTDIVMRSSITRPFRGGSVAVEEVLRLGTHLSGLTRRADAGRLIDVMDHARTLVRRQTRVRVDIARRGWAASGFYEHVHARDDTAGPFSLPAMSGDLDAERGPALGIPAHALTGVVSGRARSVRILVSARVSSGTPYSLLTGVDPEGLFTFSGRVGNTRNPARSPASSDVSAYFARQLRLPLARLGMDVGVRLENMIGALAPLDVERSVASRLAGRAVSAARGRAASIWATFGRR